MSRISNLKVYDLEESIIASGYPMRTEIENREVEDRDLNRIKNLVKASRTNGAHAQFLTGIRVNFDLTFSNKAWVEAERYRFLEFVSSQSTMHRITKFKLKNQCNKYVDDRIIDIVQKYIDDYNRLNELSTEGCTSDTLENRALMMKELYLTILYNIPSGFELTARMTTNYRCLLNIYNQRHNHRLPEWREFCEELKQLPYFEDLLSIYLDEDELLNRYLLKFFKDENAWKYVVRAADEDEALAIGRSKFHKDHPGETFHSYSIM